MAHVKRTTGADLLHRTAHPGKKLCIDSANSIEIMSYQYIEAYFDMIEARMSGSVTAIDRD